MSDLIQDFLKSVGPSFSAQAAAALNLNASTVEKILPQLAPLIITGLKKQKDEFGGPARIDHIINKYGNVSALANIGGLFAEMSKQKADPTLGGLLGNAGIKAAEILAKQYKINTDQVAKLITFLSPVLLGYLAKARDAGAGLNGIAALLDRNGDGSIFDDVAGYLLGGSGNKTAQAVGSLLGSLLKKKK
ncbi:MAG: DUF937 domain-containing protein [candidate division KSB1 bacterium]|nr:DUF937 domain-containing protein [candidate division KSB1 bacterium]